MRTLSSHHHCQIAGSICIAKLHQVLVQDRLMAALHRERGRSKLYQNVSFNVTLQASTPIVDTRTKIGELASSSQQEPRRKVGEEVGELCWRKDEG